MSLPKIPKIETNVKYPEFYIEERLESVNKTSAEDYLSTIKALLKEVEEYQQCLAYKGYTLHGLSVESDLYARKETTIR